MLNDSLKSSIIEVNSSNDNSANIGECSNRENCSKPKTIPLPTEDELDTLGVGCYVQVQSGDDCFWAEIISVNDDIFTGSIHAELGSSSCKTNSKTVTETQFTKEQVINLGCDNYCWC